MATKKPHCVQCKKAPARYPTSCPKFCTVRCAASRGVEAVMDLAWCDMHLYWYDRVNDECFGCWKERLPRGE